MDRATRKELKSDKFALEVQHSVEYVTSHRQMLTRYGTIAAAALVIVAAVYFYMRHEAGVRQEAFQAAQGIESATVGPPQSEYSLAFPTQAAKDKAADKAWTEIAVKYGGSQEGVIANYYLGGHAAEAGNLTEAAKRFQLVVDSGQANYSSLAKIALAQVDASQGKLNDSKKLLQSLIDHPTATVSKEEATIALAHILAPTDPAAARKLLEPLRGSERVAVSRAALTAISELPK